MRNMLAAAAVMALSLSTSAMAKVSSADRSFLTQDMQGGRYELALAKLGVAKAKAPAVKQYSQKLVRDHQSANPILMRLVMQEGVRVPAGMTAKDEQTLTRMRGMTGAAFDKAYVEKMVRINAEDEQAANKEKSSTTDARIKAYIKRFEAMDAKHKQGAMKLQGMM